MDIAPSFRLMTGEYVVPSPNKSMRFHLWPFTRKSSKRTVRVDYLGADFFFDASPLNASKVRAVPALLLKPALRGWWGIEFVSLKTRGPVALLG